MSSLGLGLAGPHRGSSEMFGEAVDIPVDFEQTPWIDFAEGIRVLCDESLWTGPT
jgi:hypothetical protein